MIEANEISETLLQIGFTIASKNTKTTWLSLAAKSIDVYVKNETRKEPLVIHPDNQNRFGELINIQGVEASLPMHFYHNSTMRALPSRLNIGSKETKYGIAFGFSGRKSLEVFLDMLINDRQPSVLDDFEAIDGVNLDKTERIELKKVRIGQGRFRDDLFEEFEGVCPLTGVTQPDLLRASHIKPWSMCTSQTERLTKENGLLLAANADALFDNGYISFTDEGDLMVSSSMLKNANLGAFGLHSSMTINLRTDDRKLFMKFHRENKFLSGEAKKKPLF